MLVAEWRAVAVENAGHRFSWVWWGIKNAPGWGAACFVPPRPFEGHAHVHVAGAVSVTGWGHGGGRYSQLLRVGSSSSKRRVSVEGLLLGCGLVSLSGLRGGRPTITATGPVSVLRGLRGMLRGRGIALLVRGAVTALPLVTLREVLNPVTIDLHGRLALVNVRAADSAGHNHGVSGADAETGDQVVVVAPVGDVIERLGKGVESALVVLA